MGKYVISNQSQMTIYVVFLKIPQINNKLIIILVLK